MMLNLLSCEPDKLFICFIDFFWLSAGAFFFLYGSFPFFADFIVRCFMFTVPLVRKGPFVPFTFVFMKFGNRILVMYIPSYPTEFSFFLIEVKFT